MDSTDLIYWERRAREELHRSADATAAVVARTHRRFATAYARRVAELRAGTGRTRDNVTAVTVEG